MFRKTFLFLLKIVLFTVVAEAQEAFVDTVRTDFRQEVIEALGDDGDFVVAPYRTSNIFVSASLGINSIFAEANRMYDNAFQRSQITGRMSIGKWFTPLWGMRFRVGGGRLAGHYFPVGIYNIYDDKPDHAEVPEAMKPYLSEKNGTTWFHRKFAYMDFSLDFMTDIVHWFTRKDKPFGIILFAGPGYSHGFASQGLSASNSFSFKAGGQLNYRLNKNFDLIAEIQGTVVDEGFDGIIGGNEGWRNRTVEGYASVTLGLSYNFGGKNFTRYAKVHPITYEHIRNIQPPKVVEDPEPEDIITAFTVRFFIDKYNIEEDQKLNIHRVARYLKRHPEAKLEITGFADKETAYPSYNLRLSRRRVNTVRDYLIKKCDIAPERLIVDAKGDTQRVYNEDYRWNRAVVIRVIENNTED